MNRKTVVITGGNSGIGLACADYLSQRNFRVLITARNPSRLEACIRALGGRVEGYLVDAGNLDQIGAWVAQLAAKGERSDGLFINAGIFRATDFESTTEAIFDQTMQVNFKGPFFTIQKLLPLFQRPASIVLNTSVAVMRAFPNTSAYTASKAALESLAQVLNVELADWGIRTNIISPGVTNTPILEKAGLSKDEVSDLLERLADSLPIGRAVLPTDIAPILRFLVSDESLVLRNEKIIVDGGATLR